MVNDMMVVYNMMVMNNPMMMNHRICVGGGGHRDHGQTGQHTDKK
jgi:hypothetical protein